MYLYVFPCRENAKNPAEENSAVEVYFQCGLNDTKLRASLDLLEQILSEPCFNVLRTKEQLGYSVHCGIRLTHNVLAFAFNIVSGKLSHGVLTDKSVQKRSDAILKIPRYQTMTWSLELCRESNCKIVNLSFNVILRIAILVVHWYGTNLSGIKMGFFEYAKVFVGILFKQVVPNSWLVTCQNFDFNPNFTANQISRKLPQKHALYHVKFRPGKFSFFLGTRNICIR